MQNLEALFRDKLAKFRDVILMNTLLLIFLSAILGVVVKKTRIANDSTFIGPEAFQVKLHMTLRARNPALSFLQG